MLYKVYQATAFGESFQAHFAMVQKYLIEGPASSEELVDAFTHTSFFVLDKPMSFDVYLSALSEGMAKGYGPERLYLYIDQLQNPKAEAA
jgi:hypothetical protein